MNSTQDALEGLHGRPRQIILGCDGTNNTLTGGVHDTNVLKLIGQLVPEAENQILYYDPGVGAPDQVPPMGLLNDLHRKWQRLAGLADGQGIYDNIAEAYLFLVDHYRPGDDIYLFGFSRGAFTARSVAGMVRLFGIIRTDSKSLILTLIRVYFSTPEDSGADLRGWQRLTEKRSRQGRQKNKEVARKTAIASVDTTEENVKKYLVNIKERRSTRKEVAEQVRDKFASPQGAVAPIHFMGVWDTVESVGMPGFKRKITSNGHTEQEERFRHIRHALSMDEHRMSFSPRLYWDEDYDAHPDDPARHRSLQQRWFRGVHSDVGGGYDSREAGLSDQAYRWVLKEAIACGLRTEPKRAESEHQAKPLIAHDASYDTPWWGVAGLTVRSNVTHYKDGRAYRVRVKTEGAASDHKPRMVSVWSAALRVAWIKTVAALLCALALFGWYGWTGAAAFAGSDDTHVLATIWQGVTQLEWWKVSYFLGFFSDLGPVGHGTPAGPALVDISAAVGATFIDFGLIVAYSWVVGLYGSWAFHDMARQRNPANKISWTFRLGYAPMVLVLADVAENFLSLLTIWLMWRQIPNVSYLSYLSGLAMMLACVLKWAGLFGTVALLGCGLMPKVWVLSTPAEGRRVG